MLRSQQSTIEPIRSAVLNGNVSDFITPLSPSLQGSLKGFQEAALTWIDVCRSEALDHGRPIWGWKMAGADPHSLTRIAQWFPDAKFIWIERELSDCLASAKASGMLDGAEQAESYVKRAKQCSQAFASLSANKLHLNYAEMLESPRETISKIEDYTGAQGIDPSVFDERINQFGNASYLPPSPLTLAEAAAASPEIASAL